MSRYKVFTKQWLLDNNVDLIIDEMSTRDVPTETLNRLYRNYEELIVRQIKTKGYYQECSICVDRVPHPKGYFKQCDYLMCNIGYRDENGKWKSTGIPLHRIIYVWFNDVIQPYNENGELMDICHINHNRHDNHIGNLKWDTRRNNLAERKGFINQYGYRKVAEDEH